MMLEIGAELKSMYEPLRALVAHVQAQFDRGRALVREAQ
jgi:hypothetical protein